MATKTSNRMNPFGTFGETGGIQDFLGSYWALKQDSEALVV